MGLFNNSDKSDAAKEARAILNKVHVPSIEEARAELQKYVQMGVLTPAQAETELQDQTAYRQIEEDPRLRGAQIDALNQLEGQVSSGGLDAQARADLYNVGEQQATQRRGEEEAIMANARARGQGGSDLTFVNRLLAQQGAATRGQAAGLQTAADAERRRDASLAALTQLSTNVRGQDYAKKANEAAATDAINRFNAQNRQQQNNLGVAQQNNAQATNLGEKQRAADANVGQANQIPQQVRQMEMQKATGQMGVAQQLGAAKVGENAQTRQDLGQLASYVGTAAMMMSDERAKTDKQPFDASAFLDDLTGYKFKYKAGLGQPQGQMAGVMAQDIEKQAPGAVQQGPDGLKRVDEGQMGGLILASLADVNERLKRVEGRGNAGA